MSTVGLQGNSHTLRAIVHLVGGWSQQQHHTQRQCAYMYIHEGVHTAD